MENHKKQLTGAQTHTAFVYSPVVDIGLVHMYSRPSLCTTSPPDHDRLLAIFCHLSSSAVVTAHACANNASSLPVADDVDSLSVRLRRDRTLCDRPLRRGRRRTDGLNEFVCVKLSIVNADRFMAWYRNSVAAYTKIRHTVSATVFRQKHDRQAIMNF